MNQTTWTVAQAKAKFSEVIDLAQSRGPQTVTRNGRSAVVIVAADEWERKTKRQGNLADFFAASPLRGSALKINRRTDRARKIVIRRAGKYSSADIHAAIFTDRAPQPKTAKQLKAGIRQLMRKRHARH